MRSLLRWLARVVVGAVALVALVTAIALVLAHTDWGREQLRGRVEAALREAFPGGARIAAIDGSILGTLTVRGVELDGVDRRPLATIGTLHVAVALWPLVTQTARLDRLVAEDVRVQLRHAPAGAPRAPPSAPSPWRVELPRFQVHRATIAIAAGASTHTLVDVESAGTAIVERGGIAMFGWSHARWQEGGAEVTATAAVIVDDGVRVPGALVRLGGATIAATQLAIDLDHPRGEIAVHVPRGELAMLARELGDAGAAVEPLGELVATARASAATPETTWLELAATSGATRLWASLQGEPARRTARGVISAVGIDLAAVTRGELCGRGEVLAALDGGADRVRGAVLVHGDLLAALERRTRPSGAALVPCGAAGARGQHAILALDATLAGGTALVLARGEDALQAFAIATARRDPGGAISLDRARAVVTSRAVAAGGKRVTGKLAVDVQLSRAGTLFPVLDLRIAGTASGDAVTVDDLAIAGLRGRFDLHASAAGPLGEAALTATGIRSGGTPVGRLHARIARGLDGRYRVAATARPPVNGLEVFADAVVTPRATGVVADIARSRVTLPSGMIWTGRGGAVIVGDDQMVLRGATLRSGDAAIALRGDLRRQTGELAVHADARRFALAALDPRYHGTGSGTLDLARLRGAWSGEATVAVSGVAIAPDATSAARDEARRDPATLLDGTVRLGLAGRRVTLDAHASSPALGDVALVFEATGPRDPFDLAAWRRLDRDAVHDATITARGVALPAVAALADRGVPTLTGTLDGTIHLAPRALGGALAVRGVELPIGGTGADLTFAPQGDDLGVRTTVRLADLAEAVATARLAMPQRPFDPATWRRRGRDLVVGATVTLDDVAFDPAVLDRLGAGRWLAGHGIALPYRGHARIALEVGAAASEARLAIDLDDVTGGALVAPLSQHIAITSGPRGTHVQSESRGRSGPHELSLGVFEGDVPMTLERWIAEPSSALRAPITARWTLPATPAVPVLAILGRRDLLGGTVKGRAAIHGTLTTPIVEAALTAREIALAPQLGGRPPPVLRQLDVAAAWGGASGHLEIKGSEATGGQLHAIVNGRPDQLAAATGSITTRQLDIAPIAAVLPIVAPWLPNALASAAGVVDADLALRGGRIAGWLKIARGAMPIATAVGTLRDATADVAIDERAIRATVHGKLGRGTVHLTATADDPSSINATLDLREVSPLVAMRPIIRAKLRTRLQVGEARCRDFPGAQICGEVTVEAASVTFPDHPDTPLLEARAPADLRLVGEVVESPPGPRPPAHPWLVTRVDGRPVQVEAGEVAEGVGFRATLRGRDLRVSIGERVGLHGTVEIEDADADILGRSYALERSRLDFDGTTDPQLHITMTHPFPELTLGVELRGRASKWDRPTFSSEPGGYSQDQLFGFFLGGEPGGDPGSQTREAVAGAAALAVSGSLGRRIGRALPIKLDAVSCAPAASTTTAFGSCTFGKWVSRELYLAYRQHLGAAPDENTSDVQLQYRVGRGTVIEGTGGDRQHLGADLLWRHRW